MQVLSVTSEFFPLIKTGGLADVAGALPRALADENVVMRTLLPGYSDVIAQISNAGAISSLGDLFGGDATLLDARAPDGTELLVLDAPHLFARAGNPYLGPDGTDWPDNHFRFAALAWTAAEIGKGLIEGYRPDVIHGHDWQAALAPVYLAGIEPRPATVMTIHNLAFQGIVPATELTALRLPPSSFTMDGLEYWGKISFLKGGIHYADRVTTVSPTYAREICTPDVGMGLDGVLRQRKDVLTGITNGIDCVVWNPGDDPIVLRPYAGNCLDAKLANKAALQARLGLENDPDTLLFCVISRLTAQKGFDLLLEALPMLLEHGGQLALLGSGDAALEAAFADAVRKNPGRIGAVFGYDEPLSHQLQAGADAILIPSRFEPCGLTQLYGLRYGTLPIVARVGGLADTVIDANQAALVDGVATGFQFGSDSVTELRTAIERAFILYRNKEAWQQVQRRAMSRNVGWSAAAKTYTALYRELCSAATLVS
ncbi:MAG: glycogen synthase GlgA [Pseudomonadota bacterium]